MSQTKESPFFHPSYRQPLEPERFLSWKRFKRGFKSGVRIAAQGEVIGLPIITAFVAATAPPEVLEPITNTLMNATPENIAMGAAAVALSQAELLGITGVSFGTLDSIRLTSNRYKGVLASDFFRPAKSIYEGAASVDYKRLADGLADQATAFAYGIKRLSAGAVNLGYAVVRPALPNCVADNKEKTVVVATGIGAGFGTAGYAVSNLVLAGDRLMGAVHENDQLWEMMAQDPVNTIGYSALAGLALSSYAVIAGRRSENTRN